MMLAPSYNPDDLPELTTEQIAGMAATVARVKVAVAEIVERERQRSQGLISGDRLTRHGLDAVAESLGMPPVSDEEWRAIQEGGGGTG